jgi:hypothetical protein
LIVSKALSVQGLAFEAVLIEPVSSEGAALNAAKEEAGTLTLQAISSTDTNVKTPHRQSMLEATAISPNKW